MRHYRTIRIQLLVACLSLLGWSCAGGSDEGEVDEQIEAGDQEEDFSTEVPAAIAEKSSEAAPATAETTDEGAGNVNPDHSIEALAPAGSTPMGAAATAETAVTSPAPAVSAAPSSDTLDYIVVHGDTLSRLAQRIYGDKFKWTILANANHSVKNPDRIFPGDVIKVPVVDEVSKGFSADYHQKGHTQTVQIKAGDTLSKIAKRTLGSATDWKAIWLLNKDSVKNPNRIVTGHRLHITTYYHKNGHRHTHAGHH